MKLINADELKTILEEDVTIERIHSVDEANGMNRMKMRCFNNIDKCQTVSAIPINWLWDAYNCFATYSKRGGMYEKVLGEKVAAAIQMVIEMWQEKENGQE